MKLMHIDTCLPDYFRGHHQTVMQIPVTNKTTADEFISYVNNEYNMCYDFLVEYGDWPEMDNETIQKLAADLLTVSGDEKVCPELDDEPEDDEFCDSVYVYLIFEKD